MMNFKMKNKTLFLCLPAMLNIPFGGSSVFGANSEKDNKENSSRCNIISGIVCLHRGYCSGGNPGAVCRQNLQHQCEGRL